MTININGVNCGEREIVRGSPQGSVLGCLLYCVTTQTITDDVTADVQTAQTTDEAPRPRTVHCPTTGRPRVQGVDPVLIRRPRFFPAEPGDDSLEEDV